MVNRIYPPELQLNKANTSDTEAPFWICIYLFQTDLFHLKFMISAMTGFDIVNFPFWMVTFPVLPLTGFTFLSLFGLLECLVLWLTSMPVIIVQLPNISGRAVGIINFERLSPNFIANTLN